VYRPGDVLDALFTEVIEGIGEPVADMVADRARDADAAGLRQCLQSRRDVDAVAVDVVAIGDDIAEVDPDAKRDAFVLGRRSVAVDHRALDLGGTSDCIEDAQEFHQHAVAGGLDDAPVMLPDFRIDKLATMRLQAIEGALLIRSHQPRVAGHIRGQDRRKPARRSRSYGLTRSSPVIDDGRGRRMRALGPPCQPHFRTAWLSAVR
jgi:hypothetical protein